VTQTYKEQFKEAIERTRDWDLLWYEPPMMSDYRLDVTELKTAVMEYYRESRCSWEEVVGQCFRHCVEFHDRWFFSKRIPPTITIGDVLIDGEPKYGVDEDVLKRELEAGNRPEEDVVTHAWLTFPDYTILDFTVKPSEAWRKRKRKMRLSESLTILHPKTKNSHYSYHPLLVGDKYIRSVMNLAMRDERLVEFIRMMNLELADK